MINIFEKIDSFIYYNDLVKFICEEAEKYGKEESSIFDYGVNEIMAYVYGRLAYLVALNDRSNT